MEKHDGLTIDKLQEQLGADKIEVIENKPSIHEQAALQNQKDNARLKALVTGEAKAPNTFVEYLIQGIRENNKHIEKLQNERMQLEQRYKQITNNLLTLSAEQTKALRDILNWDKEEGATK